MSVLSADYVGPAAAIATSVCWTAGSVFFTAAAKRLGPTWVNGLRLCLAVVLLGVTLRALDGSWWPELTSSQLWYLGLSGLLGLTICDQFLFMAFVDIGPRRAMLIMTTAPLFALVFGALSLGEVVGGWAIVGVFTTLAGVLWVLAEGRGRTRSPLAQPHLTRGVVLSVVAAALQALGALFVKRGVGHGELPEAEHLAPLAATYVRMVFGMAGVLPLLALHHWRRRDRAQAVTPHERRVGLNFIVLGTVFGPYIGVWLSVIAFDRSPIGVAQTLCSLSPVLILPLVYRLYGERVGARGLLGALLAVGGAALLFVT